jgi:DNA (cytosine-5)-methyltransferase 1
MVLEGNMIDTSSDFGVAKYEYKIRKLTPRETWRLMGFSDEDFEKAAAVNSQTQLYKQSGNSIVEDVLMALFSQLNIQGVIPWNEVN